jgi:hypothetical protein
MPDDLEKRIAERAHRFWEEEGHPHGRADDHWALAREAIALEDAGGGATLPNPAADHPATEEPAQPIEEAFIQENLGEFPNALTDQGEREQTPEVRPRTERKAPAQKPLTQQGGDAPAKASSPAKAAAPKAEGKPKPAKRAAKT